jgi:outer membrane protein assembly factor BamB
MMFRIYLTSIALILIGAGSDDYRYPQWRGPQRNGIYPEKGLMKKWSSAGPSMLWSFQGLGSGHGSIGPGKDKLFILGMPESNGILYAIDYTGKLVWKKEYGPEWSENYQGTRSTPVVVGNRVYFESGTGTIYCFDTETGSTLWSVDMFRKFGARKITWGMAESLLIEGDYLYCTPGGKEINVAALNRFTGETVWASQGNSEPSAYCSPVLVKHNNTSMVVTITAGSVIGLDAKTGKMYWHVEHLHYNKIHANSPVYYKGWIICSSEYDRANSGLLGLRLSDDGKSVSSVWRNEDYKNLIGGIIVKDGYIYGAQYQRNSWCCLDCSTGKLIFSSNKFGDGNIIMADNLFYCYSEKGEVALVNATPSSFDIISKFRIPLGTDPHWAHPVIYQGRLYIRHGDALMAYDIVAK